MTVFRAFFAGPKNPYRGHFRFNDRQGKTNEAADALLLFSLEEQRRFSRLESLTSCSPRWPTPKVSDIYLFFFEPDPSPLSSYLPSLRYFSSGIHSRHFGIKSTREFVAYILPPLLQFWRCAPEEDGPAQDQDGNA